MKRKILFDLGHPGHFHLFKRAIIYFKNHPEYQVYVTTRDVPIIISLLRESQINYHIIGTKRNGFFGKFFSVIESDFQMLLFVIRHKIDLGLHCGIIISHVSLVTKMRSWIFDDDDDDVEPLMVKFSHPFSEFVFTPDCINRKTKRVIYYPGTHELSYLYYGVESMFDFTEKYSIIRLVAFNGHHDYGHNGLDDTQLVRLVERLERNGRVFITSERILSEKWEKYRISVPADKMHSLMSGALVVVGDSQTMISEAASMGVPAFKCNSFAGKLSVPNMLEKEFGLCFSFTPGEFDSMLKKIEIALENDKFRNDISVGLSLLRRKKIDTSKLIIYCVNQWRLDFQKIREFSQEDWLSLP
jgi:predicted glycosyltransferase